MESELLLQTSWPTQSYFHSNLDHYDPNMDFYESYYHEFSSSINSSPENSLISSEPYVKSPLLGYDQIQNPSMVDNINTLDDVCQWLCDENQEIEEIQSEKSTETESVHVWSPDLSMTSDDVMETRLEDLLKAYADAMTMGQTELVKCRKSRR
ncbi:unnamed protein product [Lactuca virosa]|uniref:Uncharacterized protein n=1 Tax=Lactuca virosa TaxID=75947 RepID=A0AAU9P7M9_9ASTR|nr:unnamed protein product [Lactuca virosa]